MKVLFITAGDERLGSSRIRVYQYLPYLDQAGIKSVVVPLTGWLTGSFQWLPRRIKDLLSFSERRLIDIRFWNAVKQVREFDLVFLQKALMPLGAQKQLMATQKPIIIDWVDAIFDSHQLNQGSFELVRKWMPQVRWKRLRFSLIHSRCVIVDNPINQQIVQKYNQNIMLIAGPIDTRHYSPRPSERDDGKIVIGWIGSPPNTIYLQPLYSVFQRLAQAYPQVVFEFIGAQSFELPGVELRFTQWTLETEVENLHHFDIGIMPLPDDEWSRAKGGYKLLQYMALGIPSVASPVGINSKLVSQAETGYLVSTEDEWFQKLKELVVNAQLRQSMGQKARSLAVSRYSFQVAATQLTAALQSAVSDKI